MEDMNEPFISSKTVSIIVHIPMLASKVTKTSLKLLGVLGISHLIARADMERGGESADAFHIGSRDEVADSQDAEEL